MSFTGALQGLLFGLVSAAVLLLPGLALYPWLPRRAALPELWELLADALGLSIALHVLLALLAFVLGIRPGALGLAALGGLALLSLAAAARLRRLPRLDGSWKLSLVPGLAALGGIAALRIVQARVLVFPNWVDSVHHSLIVGAFIQQGGIPRALQLTTAAPFHYHYGFHLLAAEAAALARIPADQAVLWFGHALFAASSLALYRLGRALGLDRRGAFAAGLLPGFVLFMPAYYVSWGRYTLLTGLAILPVAMAAALELLAEPRATLRQAIPLVLLTAGLCLTHYLALLLYLLFLAVAGLVYAWPALRARRWAELPWLTVGACLAGGLLALPWLGPMLRFNAAQVSISEARAAYSAADFKGFVDLLRPEQSWVVMGLAALCLPAALVKKDRPGLRIIALWGLLLTFFAMPFAPRLGPFRPDHFTIVLFLPAALLLGWGLSGGAAALAARRGAGWGNGLLLLALALLLIWGVSKGRSVVNSKTIIADAADRRALEWVAQNTPPDARFYINSTPWVENIYRGVDGGYWLLPFTGRSSLVPPVVYVWQPEETWSQVNDWARRSQKLEGCTPDFWELARAAGLTFVYVREGKGSLQPAVLDDCPRLEAVYRQEGVGIYRILQP